MLKRIISLVLCAVMVLSILPAQTLATETEPLELVMETEPVAETTESAEEVTAPTEAVTEPVEEETIPTEAETTPAEEGPEPVEDITAPTAGELQTDYVEPAFSDMVMVSATSGTCGRNATWSYNNGTLTISGSGVMDSWYSEPYAPWSSWSREITSVVIEDGIESIGQNAFRDHSYLKNVKIPETAAYILACSFYGCSSLTDITLPENAYLDSYVFTECSSLRSIRLPVGTTTIETGTFYGCSSLSQIEIPAGVTTIEGAAFQNCANLSNISLPENLTHIGGYAFSGCTTLTNIDLPASITSISEGAFWGCTGLTSIKVPSGVTSIYSSVFHDCSNLRSVVLPSNIEVIGYSAFGSCYSLNSVEIPRKVTNIGQFAFGGCRSLTEISFKGDAPEIAENAFNYITATAYYPENNTTWTNTIKQNYGGTITWCAYTVEDEPEEPCTLAELKTIDYLAFSQAAYRSFTNEKTLRACLEDQQYWNKIWGEDGITYAHLCKNIAEWEVLCQMDNTPDNGFYAVAFKNKQNEVVISYRGSKPLDQMWDADTWNDWAVTDIPMQVFKTTNGVTQYLDAFTFYETVLLKEDWKEVHVTGHSLGGALAYIVSARYGCRGVTMNSISVFEPIYESEYAIMGENFWGVNAWNFMDHVNIGDSLAGMWEYYQTNGKNVLKPFTSYKSNYEVHDPFLVGLSNAANHGLKSFVSKSGNDVVLNTVDQTFVRSKTYSSYKVLDTYGKGPHVYRTLVLGTTGSDTHQSAEKEGKGYFFGGDGPDTFNGYNNVDVLIGGPGGDRLDGGRDDDLYIYYKGDGVDFIWDTEGDDELRLYGFSASDDIQVYKESGDAEYLYILCNGEAIVRIYTEGRTYKNVNWGSDEFDVNVMLGNNGIKNIDITEYFSTKKYTANLKISCPVNVEVLDANGSVVYTLLDGEAGSYYTDYGNFYIYEEEDGGYGKTLDLVEGYSVRIVGMDEGTMDIAYRDVEDGELSEIENTVADVPVSVAFTAIIEENTDGAMILAADTDGDGTVDQEVAFDAVDTGPVENRVMIDASIAEAHDSVWIDGKEYAVQTENGASFVDLPDGSATNMAVYTFSADDAADVHTHYPVSMKVWTLSNEDGIYTATRVEELDDILRYSGASIRTTGEKGIRMITSIKQAKKNTLTGDGLAGFTLKEYGTVVAWAEQLADQPLVLGASYAKSNYAYKKGVSDPVFNELDGLMQYTNVLVNFTDAQCKKDLSMRSYMILEDEEGNEVTLYGGIVTRSIGYIAYQNRNEFEPSTESYEYIWDIIHTVYGNIYDEEYQG